MWHAKAWQRNTGKIREFNKVYERSPSISKQNNKILDKVGLCAFAMSVMNFLVPLK
jgi:hypothetical protein